MKIAYVLFFFYSELSAQSAMSDPKLKGLSDAHFWGIQPSHRCPPLFRMWMSLITIIMLWMIISIAFYHVQEGWSLVDSFFFVSNVGMGVGYGFPVCKSWAGKIFTIFHVMIGSSFAVSGLQLIFYSFLERQRRIHRDHSHDDKGICYRVLYHIQQGKYRLGIVALWFVYAYVGVAFGLNGHLIDTSPSNSSSVAVTDSVLFVITSMSTAAQFPPKQTEFALYFAGVYVLFGIPLYNVVMSIIADSYINQYQRAHVRQEVLLAVSVCLSAPCHPLSVYTYCA